jgi:hypothetical protein
VDVDIAAEPSGSEAPAIAVADDEPRTLPNVAVPVSTGEYNDRVQVRGGVCARMPQSACWFLCCRRCACATPSRVRACEQTVLLSLTFAAHILFSLLIGPTLVLAPELYSLQTQGARVSMPVRLRAWLCVCPLRASQISKTVDCFNVC